MQITFDFKINKFKLCHLQALGNWDFDFLKDAIDTSISVHALVTFCELLEKRLG